MIKIIMYSRNLLAKMINHHEGSFKLDIIMALMHLCPPDGAAIHYVTPTAVNEQFVVNIYDSKYEHKNVR